MYPLNMQLKTGVGFAVANDEAEHKALTEQGFDPEYIETEADEATETAKRGPGRPRKES